MLSEDLKSLHDRLKQYRRLGVTLEPGGVSNICAILRGMMRDAEALEQNSVRQPCIVQTSSDVINIMPIMQRRQLDAYGEQCGVSFIVHTDDDPDDAA